MEILDDTFFVKEIDMIPSDPSKPWVKTKNKNFLKVSRIYAVSENSETELILDVNTEIYKIRQGDRLDFLVIEKCLENQNEISIKNFNPDNLGFIEKNPVNEYEYIMYGVIFHSGVEKDQAFLYASFGGLLLKIFKISGVFAEGFLKNDLNILLMIRKRE